AAEQRETRVHLEQQPVRRLETHARREAQAGYGERLEQAALGPMRSLEHSQCAGEREGRAEIETRADASLPCGGIQGDGPEPPSGGLDDDGRTTVLVRAGCLDRLQRKRWPVHRDPQLLAARAKLRFVRGTASLSERQS